jgi:hypothetical protein
MLITRISPISKTEHTIDIPCTEQQLYDFEVNDVLIQDAMPNLTPEQREFILTGITEAEWNEVMGDSLDFDL